MLTPERQSAILKLVNEKNSVTVAELVKLFDTSESTIRRDLITLDENGKLKKVHGGATSLVDNFTPFEYDVQTKTLLNVTEKEEIGKYAASLILDDDFVFIDAGTSTLHMVEHIENTKATFVTNGVEHAKKLLQKGLEVYIIGGKIKFSTEAIIGIEAIENVKKYNFTKCFMGTNGISVARGLSTPDVDEAMLKKQVVELSYLTFILADNSKFGKTSPVTFADIKKVCIITDKLFDKSYAEHTIIKEVL